MKNILGLDLGTTSIGWAFVKEAENKNETSEIINLGVRVNPLTTDEQTDFEKGRPLSVNADRTLKRGARRNLDRYKQRREHLINLLTKAHIITPDTILTEHGKESTFQTLELRAKSAQEKVKKEELARILLTINKKRGYKSNRKAKGDEDGQLIDGMEIAKRLSDENITPGQLCLEFIKAKKKNLPDFYRSDLQSEFDIIWGVQKQYHPDILDDELYQKLKDLGQQNTRKRLLAIKGIYTAENKGKREKVKRQAYQWRCDALHQALTIEEVAYVLAEINNNLTKSSGYLGAISDRSKELYFKKETVGENLYKQIQKNRHTSLKNQVFYRQDYLDEFEQIWETQKEFHPELNSDLKEEVRDCVIFYQRRLKSQKGLISFCEFESKKVEIEIDGKLKTKTIGSRVCPKSSPLFQEFKIWQNLSNVIFKNKLKDQDVDFIFNQEMKEFLFNELNIKGPLKKDEVLKLLKLNKKEWDINYTELQGNTTNKILYEAYQGILQCEGYELDLKKETAIEIKSKVKSIFKDLGIETEILNFNAELDTKDFQKQKMFQLFHLLYSYEGDNSNTGDEALYQNLESRFGFKKSHAQFLIQIQFEEDYGNLSSKAIRKIFPYIREQVYSEACAQAGYNHSNSLTKEENNERKLVDKLELLQKNSLRNPVVEKILNQMINVINAIIEDPKMGKPDEIRIELARELKKNAKERAEMTQGINTAKTDHENFKKILQSDFGILNPSRNDIIRYKLYQELKNNGFKTLYSMQYISPSQLFSKEIDIEHIIPKARLFDDSFSNKTLEFRHVNLKKGDSTAYDYMNGDKVYVERIEDYYKNKHINKAKRNKLLMKGSELGEGFIERDLRESQYIAKKAKEMLQELCRTVVSTSGSITNRLRDDWGIINVMKELNIEKYRALGLTEFEERKDGQKIEKIIDWTKRNDHRHHAMDALTVAFTKHSHIQYLNNLNARKNETDKLHKIIIAIEDKELIKDDKGKRLFKEPFPNFRHVAKQDLQNILISHKAKNKVVTRNKNKVKGSKETQISLTPRGQLHKETIYGKSQSYATKLVKVGTTFDETLINQVSNTAYKAALLKRLNENDGNPKKAFGGKNSPTKNPVQTANGLQLPEKVKIVWFQNNYTIRKDITPDLKIEKVVDKGVQDILRKRLANFGGKAKEAFIDLDKNPIWLNEEKGISIKRVTISGVSNAEALHSKKDHFGNAILDEDGKEIAVDFVSTGNNHHVAIYRDEKGKLQEEVVSFYEAVARVNAGDPIINKTPKEGWEFLFTMKQNEMFVFPSEDFDPSEIDLENPDNRERISPHLFRVQKFTIKDYFFRHHLETIVDNTDKTKGTSWKREGLAGIFGIIKVRINHLGQIVSVGEY